MTPLSHQEVLRVALLDMAFDQDPSTLSNIVSWQLHKGRSPDRLALFAVRRLHIGYYDALLAICYLCPDILN